MSRDMIFAFIGGVTVGAASCYGVMIKLGYVRPDGMDNTDEKVDDPVQDKKDKHISETESSMLGDSVSYTQPKEIDTLKVRYDSLEEKPNLDELVKKYDKYPIPQDDSLEDRDEESDGDPDPDLADMIQTTDDDIEYGHAVIKLPGRKKDDLIFLIREDYAGECYLLEDLFYYEKDGVLADVTDAPVDDVLGVIGDSLGYFGKYSEDPDKLYVRNCRIGIEYEVTLVHSRYADKLYGVDSSEIDEKPKKTVRRMRKERDDE